MPAFPGLDKQWDKSYTAVSCKMSNYQVTEKQLFDFAFILPVFLDVGTFVFCTFGIDDEKALKGL